MKNIKFIPVILITLFIFITLSACSQSFTKGPYLILADTNTEIKVLWQDNATSTDQIRWGDSVNYSEGPFSSTEYDTDHQHVYLISGLTPGSKYYYQVQVGDSIHRGSFVAAPPATATSIKFLAYGDTRTNPGYHNNVARQINKTWTDDPGYQTILLSMGDLVSNGSSEPAWTKEFFNYNYPDLVSMLANIPYESAIGNHEFYFNSTLFSKYFPYHFVGNYYYSFDYGPAQFIFLDQFNASLKEGSPQYNWLVKELKFSKKPWKFICLHSPGWSGGGGHANNMIVQNVIQPLCEKYHVPIVFAGHNHYYARAEVPAADGSKIQHITTGGGGAPLYNPDPSSPYLFSYAKVFHFCKINILNENVLRFEAISSTGEVIDHFVIDRTH